MVEPVPGRPVAARVSEPRDEVDALESGDDVEHRAVLRVVDGRLEVAPVSRWDFGGEAWTSWGRPRVWS
ncbi:hypothetical protein G5V58_04995 [Nocardioides anomalus]|uniref:Uncharacterized protein n=1 Tax=Nocardioides anomalus TaxID=2712223 RepID=A0A6G6WAG3_9ACTN|nr:hypothetical protein [Nocardioides anomalus]QIG42206.1 hypothetical protein G5V58_04995 [Nocardioides anomalus]